MRRRVAQLLQEPLQRVDDALVEHLVDRDGAQAPPHFLAHALPDLRLEVLQQRLRLVDQVRDERMVAVVARQQLERVTGDS